MRLPVYEQQVRLAPKNRTDLRVDASPNAFGAQIGGAIQDLGQGIGRMAEAAVFKEDLIATADAKAGQKAYADFRREVLYDPNTGALVQTGANAFGETRAQAETRLAERRKEIEAGLSPKARRAFSSVADSMDGDAADALIKNEATELRSYVNTQSEALIGTHLTDALDNYGDDTKWSANIGLALAEIDEAGALNGIPPEKIAQQKADVLSGAHSNRAIRIATDDPGKADAYVDAHKEELGEEAYNKLKTGMEAAVVEYKAQQAVDNLRGDDAYIGKRGAEGETWLRHNNKGERNLPINDKLVTTLSCARDMGLTVEVTSGGQKSEKELYAEAATAGLTGSAAAAYVEARHEGSTRHDHGNAADIHLYKDGRLLSWKNPNDLPYFKEFVARAKANGATGFGAGDGYMGENTIHVGYGAAGVWGAEGSSGAAAPWLVEAYAGSGVGAIPMAEGAPSDEGMSTRSAYEAVMRIEDPKIRAAAMAKLDGQLKTEAALIAADQKDAGDEAWRMFTQGNMAPEDVPMDLQIKMGRENTLNFFESARAYGAGTLVTDEERYSEIMDAARLEPERFAGMNLNDERLNFSKSDFRVIEELQRTVKEGMASAEQSSVKATQDPENLGKLRTEAKKAYEENVYVPKDQKDSKTAFAGYNRFQEQVESYASQFMSEKGRVMTGPEQSRLFSMLLTPIIIEDETRGWGGRAGREALMFDAPFREGDQRVRGNIPAEDISLVDEQKARAELKDFYGREPSDDEIVTHYNRKVLADRGVSPEMEYEEVPSEVRTRMLKEFPDASDEELVDMYINFVLETAKK
jgi:hypothetical protein